MFTDPWKSAKTVSIRSTRLDDYFASGQSVNLIQTHIQGYELYALKGAARVLRESPSIKLLLEFWPFGLHQAGADWKDLVSLLEDYGLTISRISKHGLEPLQGSIVNENPAWYVNLMAVAPNELHRHTSVSYRRRTSRPK